MSLDRAAAPYEDLNEIHTEAFCACCDWRMKIEPFQETHWVFFDHAAEALGKDLTAHVDAVARAKKAAKVEERRTEFSLRIREVVEQIAADAAWHQDRTDHVAAGW